MGKKRQVFILEFISNEYFLDNHINSLFSSLVSSFLFIHIPSINNIRNYSTLTHINQEGKASMVDVSSKVSTTRVALAQSKIKVRFLASI